MIRTVKIFTLLIAATICPARAQDWAWEADHTYLSPHIAEGTVLPDGGIRLCDLDGDRILEMVAIRPENSQAFTQAGNYPDLIWQAMDPNPFEGLQVDEAEYPHSFQLVDLNFDGMLEVVIHNYMPFGRDQYEGNSVYINLGDLDDPRWARNDSLMEDILALIRDEYEDSVFYSAPIFCDWDGDRLTDLLIEGAQTYRVEQDGEGNWALSDEAPELRGWLSEVDNIMVDLDGDGDLDLIRANQGLYGRLYTDVLLNRGDQENPDYEWVMDYDYGQFVMPGVGDLNRDDSPDLVSGDRFRLNVGGMDIFGSPVRWSVLLNATTLLHDFTGDGVLEIIQGEEYGMNEVGSGDQRWAQYMSTPSGWQDTLFLGYDWTEEIDDPWPTYYKLTGFEHFQFGYVLVVTRSVIYDPRNPQNELLLYRLQVVGEERRWVEVPNYFANVLDSNLVYQIPHFTDFNNDGRHDLVTLEGNVATALQLIIYRFDMEGPTPVWERMDAWEAGIDFQFGITSLALDDFDMDGDADMVACYSGDQRIRFYENVGGANAPEWRLNEEALAEGGPAQATVLLSADANDDGKPDLFTGDMCYLNRTQPRSVRGGEFLPIAFNLSAFPNPFNSTATVTLSLPVAGLVNVGLFDAQGRRVGNLVNDVLPAGVRSLPLNARDLPSGSYTLAARYAGQEAKTALRLVR